MSKLEWLALALLVAGVGVVVWAVWFLLTHHCVADHDDVCQSCTTVDVGTPQAPVFLTTCVPYACKVCDEWAENE